MNRAGTWALAGGLAVLACVLTAITPQAHLTYVTTAMKAPFEVPLGIGDRSTSRELIVTPVAVRVARSLHVEDQAFEGSFVVFELIVDSTGAQPDSTLEHTTLEIDGRTYTPTDRSPGSLESFPLVAGAPVTGMLVFEVPADAVDEHARLEIATDGTARFDDVLVLDVDLGSLRSVGEARYKEVAWAG